LFTIDEKGLTDLLGNEDQLQSLVKEEFYRFYMIAGISIKLVADLPISNQTFSPKLGLFEVESPGNDKLLLHHHFYNLNWTGYRSGKQIYRKSPWTIYYYQNKWIYKCNSGQGNSQDLQQVALFTHDHSFGDIYNEQMGEQLFIQGNLHSLTLFPTD
jgi:hypothetical protein